MDSPQVTGFISAAQEFCRLCERPEPPDQSDLWDLRSLLLRLIFHIPAVESAPKSTVHDGERLDHGTWLKVVERFRNFPFDPYRVVFDTHDLAATDEPVIGLLSDDIGDIYSDLAGGLSNHRRGHTEDACLEWSQSYRQHWGRHAVNALAAIEIYRTDNFMEVVG